MRPLSLDHLTVFSLTPPEQVALAASLGCQAVNIRVHPMPRAEIPDLDMIGDTPMRRETKRLCRDLGVEIALVEVFMLFGRTDVESFRPAVESAAELGARVANVACMDRDRSRFHDKFALFADMAAGFGLRTSVEPFGAGPMFHLGEAMDAIAASGRGDAGVLVDALHLMRAGDHPRDIDKLDPRRILYTQFSDGPLAMPPENVVDEAMYERRPPGEGEFPLAELVRRLPLDVPIGIEVPMRSLEAAGVGPGERAARAVEATRRLLGSIE